MHAPHSCAPPLPLPPPTPPSDTRRPGLHVLVAQAATLADKRLVVAIDCWEADSLYPSGHYVRTLGAIGDKETETEVGGLHSLMKCMILLCVCCPCTFGFCFTVCALSSKAVCLLNWLVPACCCALLVPAHAHLTRRTRSAPCCAPPQVLLIENDINTSPFTAAVHACVPPLPWAVSEADLSDPSR